jgi:hypothetical protein
MEMSAGVLTGGGWQTLSDFPARIVAGSVPEGEPGMLSRGAANAPAQDGTEATLRFTVTRLGQDRPALASSVTGKNGSGLNLKTALQLA